VRQHHHGRVAAEPGGDGGRRRAVLGLGAGHVRDGAAERAGRAVGDDRRPVQARDGRLDGVARVLALARERLDQHEPERVDVGGGGDLVPADLFGGHVGGGADDGAGGGGDRAVQGAGDAEVDQPGPVAVEQHVRRLHVAVHEPVLVDVRERGGQAGREAVHLGRGQRPVVDHLGQRRPVHELGDDEGPRPGAVTVEQADETGVLQAGQGRDLAALLGAVAGRARRCEQLDGDHLPGGDVLGPVHHRRRAASDDLPQQVALADQSSAVRRAVHHVSPVPVRHSRQASR
jgi:hypothetical protein